MRLSISLMLNSSTDVSLRRNKITRRNIRGKHTQQTMVTTITLSFFPIHLSCISDLLRLSSSERTTQFAFSSRVRMIYHRFLYTKNVDAGGMSLVMRMYFTLGLCRSLHLLYIHTYIYMNVCVCVFCSSSSLDNFYF